MSRLIVHLQQIEAAIAENDAPRMMELTRLLRHMLGDETAYLLVSHLIEERKQALQASSEPTGGGSALDAQELGGS